MAHKIDPKRFPNFLRARQEQGPYAKIKVVSGGKSKSPGKSRFDFRTTLIVGSALMFFGVFFADKIPDEPYYPYCSYAHSAGVSPLHRGDPGYRPQLDADGDGIACEPLD